MLFAFNAKPELRSSVSRCNIVSLGSRNSSAERPQLQSASVAGRAALAQAVRRCPLGRETGSPAAPVRRGQPAPRPVMDRYLRAPPLPAGVLQTLQKSTIDEIRRASFGVSSRFPS